MFKKSLVWILMLAMLLCAAFVTVSASEVSNGSSEQQVGTTVSVADEAGGSVKSSQNVAKVGNTEYATIDEAIANWTNGTTLTLLADVILSDTVTLNSTEHHILNLGTFTMTAASGKDAFVIKACGNGSAERTALTIKADATAPGGINAGSKCIVYYKYADGGISTEDRPIIKIEGGVFNASTSAYGTTGIYTVGSAARKCATLNISGGTFNCSIYGSGKSKLLISGGTFNYSVGSQGDSTALRLISGGKFKTLGFMTADSNNTKFWFGTSMANSNVGLYVDANGYLVVGGPVITEVSPQYPAVASNATKWSSYLQYSSAATYGLFYEDPDMAISKHGKDNVTIYVAPPVTIPDSVEGDSAIVEEIRSNTALENYTPENLPENAELEIVLESVGDKFVYDVTPVVDGTKVEPTEAITFRLPVPASVTLTVAKVYHEDELMGTYAIKGEGNGKYVEISSPDFSAYTVEPVDMFTVAHGTLEISPANTLAEALECNELLSSLLSLNDPTVHPIVTLNGDYTLEENFVLTGEYAFILDLNGKTLTVAEGVALSVGSDVQIVGTGSIVGDVQLIDDEDAALNVGNSIITDGMTVADANGNVMVKGEDGSFVTPVAKVGDTYYTSIELAIAAAQAGETVEIIAAVADKAFTIDKNLTIKGAVTLNNVSITAASGKELTVEGLSFTGNSWIDSCGAAKLTVKNVTASVAPSNTAATNSRSAFISLGRTEAAELDLTIDGCEIVIVGGDRANAVLGWAKVDEVVIKGSTFGSADRYFNNADAIKFMSIADGADFTIEGNTVYSNYNGIVFGQNTTRDNAYTVNVKDNTFIGGADHIWVEVSGANACHASINASGGNTVNGNAFTANDIKLLPNLNSFTGYLGVDVAFDAEDKIIGGSFIKAPAADLLAESYEAEQGADGTYSIIKCLVGSGTEATPYLINTIEDLILFRDSVNAGETKYNANGVYVALAADIDLENAEWAPIGTKTYAFKGIFDGNEKTIENLKITSGDYVGLFGVINTPAVVKNVTVKNVSITGSSYLGGIVGMAFTGTIEGCSVEGKINIQGHYMVGGITGHGYARIYDCSVIGEGTGNYITATYKEANLEGDNVGGIVGHNAETNVISGCTVKNVTVSGTRKVGGIVGITAQNGRVIGCTVSGITVETTATAEYAADNAKTMGIGGLIGQFQAAGSNNGEVSGCVIKDVAFNNVNNVTVSIGAVTGGLRGSSNSTVKPADTIDMENISIDAASMADTNNLFLTSYVAKIGGNYYATFEAVIAAAQAGDEITLLADVELNETLSINKSIIIDGNGHKITQSETCVNQYALLYFDAAEVLDIAIKNVTFDGIKGGAVIRTLGANVTIDNCVFQNCDHNQVQGLLRLTQGKASVKNSKFLNNKCTMVITFNYDTNGLEGDTFLVDNCVFEGNTANSTAAIYYVKGAGCTITNSEFVGNKVNCASNGATIYLGFQDKCVVTGNMFKNNVVTDSSTSQRVAGAIFAGYQATITNNAFENNTASNANGDVLGQICISTYYGDGFVELSGNYWGGEAPVYGKDYTIQHQTYTGDYGMDSYYKEYVIDTNGNVVLDDADKVELSYQAKIGTKKYATIQAAIAAAQDGDTVTIAAGEFGAINISNKNIIIQGTVGANGELLTTIKGGNPAITGHGFNGTIKDIKIVDAFKVMYAEPAGNVTVDNVYVTGATYGFHLVAYSTNLTWTIQNSYMDLSWANSFGVSGGGDAAIIITGNVFESTSPYYPDAGARVVNTFLPNVTVKDNVFGENTKIFVASAVTDTSKIVIAENYHADGLSEALASGGQVVFIPSYYTDEAMQNLVTIVAKVGDTFYGSFADALAAAKAGDEVTLYADVALSAEVTLPAGIILNGNGKSITGATVLAGGNLTFKGYTKMATFNAGYDKPVITISEGATLEMTTGRMVIGHGATFNIVGTITDAKTANVADLVPSLIIPGASFTGAGVNFNVTNAYVKFTAYCSSKNSSANGTFNINVENSIWEQTGSLVFSEPTSGNDPTFNFTLKDSVLNSTSHLVFGVTKGEIVFDNSNVNVGAYRQLENRSTLTIKNGSVVYAAHATSSNAKNPGTTIVENATYMATGEFTGSDVGIGTLILKKGANVTMGKITKANIVVDATGMTAGEIGLTANLSALAGTVSTINSYVLEAMIVDGKLVLAERTLLGSGTETDPYLIYNIADLILFRDSVNAGETTYNAPGVWVALAADIDMAGIDWSVNIGDDCNATFDGIFDGKNFTIKNLTSTETAQKGDGYVCTGLFGAIAGNAVIKNLTIDSANIQTGSFTGNNAGVLVGFVWGGNCTIEKVTVQNATVDASGIYGTGAIVGYVYYSDSLTIKDCTVVNTTITAASGAGAVVGHTTGTVSVENCSVSNVSIEAQAIVGGIAGVVTNGFTATGSTVKDVTLTVTKPNWVNSTGIVVGAMSANAITVSGTVYENVNETAIVGSGYAVHPDFVVPAVQAKIGNKYYTTLAKALEAASAGDEIVLLTSVVVNAGETLTLDKAVTITYTSNVPGEDMITNRGTLIVDGATLVYVNTDTTASNVTVSTISSEAGSVLEIKSGEVRNDSANNGAAGIYAFAIDLLTNGSLGDVTATISGGKVISTNYMAIRQFNNGTACENTLTVAGGYIYGAKRAIQIHMDNNAGILSITGGQIEAGNYALCLFPKTSTNIAITGGTFVGTVYSGTNGIISGGTFDEAVYEGYCAEGYIPTANGDGTFGVKVGVFTVRNTTTGVGYETLAEAVEAAQAGDEITLLADIEASEVIMIGKSLTINGNGHKIISTATRVIRVTTSNVEVTLNDVNMVSRTVMTYPNDIRGISIDGSLTNVKLTLNNCSVDFTDASACDWAYAVNVSGNGTGHTLTVNGGSYEGANVINVHGASNTVTVKDATLTSLYPNSDAYYGAGIWVLQNQGSSVVAENNVFNGSNAIAFNLGNGTALTDSNNTDNMTMIVAKIGTTYYTSLEDAFKAATAGCEIDILHNVVIDEYWDARYTGSKFTVPVTIDGNGKTIKFTNTVYDGGNYMSAFRFEADATVKNLTIDMREAVSGFAGRFRAISAKADLTVDGCTFIGNGSANNTRAIIFGEGAGAAVGEVDVSITNSEFEGWKRAISDNENAQDAKTVIITDNTMTDASVNVSASESIVFTGNTVKDNATVTISSYAQTNELSVVAKNNDLEAGNHSIAAKVIDAQAEFMTPVAQIGGKLYLSIQSAIDAAAAGDTVTVLVDVALAEGLVIAEDDVIILDLAGKKISRNTNVALSTATITNNGNLTITDSIGGGKITAFAQNPDTADVPYYANNTITNCGVLTVKGGTIENSTGDNARAAFPIDNNSTLRDAILYIEGGEIVGRGAIRQFANSTSHKNEVYVSGGSVNGSSYAVWVQNPGSGDPLAKLEISGGTVAKILFSPSANFDAAITGGIVKEVAIWEADTTNTDRNPAGFITGGTFGAPVAEEFCAAGYIPTANGDGTFGVKVGTYVARNTTTGVGYETLQAALNAAQAGDTILVFEGTYALPALKAGITIEGVGEVLFEGTLSGTLEDLTLKNIHIKGSNAQRWAYAKGDLVFENVTFEATGVYALHFDGITAGATLLYKDCTIIGWAAMSGSPASCVFDGCTIKGNGSYGLIRTYFDATIENCTFDVSNVNPNDAYQDGIHAVDATVTVNNSTNVNGDMKDIIDTSKVGYIVLDGESIHFHKFVQGETVAPDFGVDGYTVYTCPCGEVEHRDIVAAKIAAAQIGNVKYESLAEALAAAQAGDTITLMADITENVTIAKNITLEGADFSYTGTMTVNTSLKVTIQNVNFVKGSISEAKGSRGTLTITSCDFDGVDNSIGYAISVRGADKLVIENSTAKNYSYGMLYIPSAVASISVKDVKVENVTAAFNISYSGDGTFENVEVSNATYGFHIQNHGARTFTLKNCNFDAANPVYVQVKGTAVVTFKLEEANDFGANAVTTDQYTKLVLTEGATLKAIEGLNVTTPNDDNVVVYKNGIYSVALCVAKIGDAKFESIQAAVDAASNGDEIDVVADFAMDITDGTLNEDSYYALVVIAGKDITIDLNGKQITVDVTNLPDGTKSNMLLGVFCADTNGKLTLKDSVGGGAVSVVGGEVKTVYSLMIAYEGLINVESGSYSVDYMNSGRAMIYGNVSDHSAADGSNAYAGINIYGGNFYLGNVDTLANGSPWILATSGSNEGKYIYVVGGTYNDDVLHQHWAFEVLAPTTKALLKNNDGTYTVVDAVVYVRHHEYSGHYTEIGYATLQDAIAAAEVDDVIVVTSDIALEESIEITADKKFTLDLNGHTISMSDASAKGAYMILNRGELTIDDTVGDGKLTFVSTTPSASNAYSTSTIGNAGVLTVVNGTIENTTAGGASYAIDTVWYDRDVALNIQGGNIVSQRTAIRQVPFSTTYTNELTISGGVITGGYAAVQTHNISAAANLASVVISGGELNGDYAYYTYYYNSATSHAGTDIQVTGGTFNGYLFIYNGNAGSSATDFAGVSVEGGIFNSGAYIYTKDETGAEVAIPSITGGTFASADAAAYCAEGFGLKDNGDGTYDAHEHIEGTVVIQNNVAPDFYVEGSYDEVIYCTVCGAELSRETVIVDALIPGASVNGTYYATLQDAINAAQAGDTIQLHDDQSYTGYLIIDGITFDLNGHELTVNGAMIALKGSNLIDSQVEKGKLKVASKNSLVLSDVEYPMLPIWVGDGYVFAEVLEQNKIIAGEDKFTVQFRPMLIVGNKSDATGANKDANVAFTESILANGASDNGLTIEIFIHCMKGGVEVEELHFVVPEEMIKDAYANNRRFSLTINGATAEFADEYVVTIAVKSDRNVSFETTLQDTYKPTASSDAQ